MPILTKTVGTGKTASGAPKRPAAFHGRIPTKTNINFAVVGVKRTRWWLVILVAILILAAAAAVAKFLVLDRLAEVSAAENEAGQVRSQLSACYDRIAEFGELNEAYAHYTYSGMTEEELARVDRADVMELLQRVVFPLTDVSTWDLSGNQLTMNIEGRTLQDINLTVQKLMEDELVDYCEISTATTEARSRRDVRPGEEMVTANVIAYLTKPEEVAEK